MKIRLWMPATVLAFLPLVARADVRPSAIISEGMVLQQKSDAKIWGDADKGEKVTVTFRGKTESATANDAGKWLVTIPTGDAGGPFDLTIEGKNKLAYKNVAVGEVWICSGQSNMEWRLSQCGKDDLKAAQDAPANPNLRMFFLTRATPVTPQENCDGKWVSAAPDTVAPFSAVGYFFGKDLNEKLKVPVGLIYTNWGGTRAEAWTKKEVLDGHELFKNEHPSFAKALENYKNSQKKPETKVDPKAGKDDPKTTTKVETKKVETKAVANPVNANSPSVLYNGMIAPILNYRVKGAIWYQGESNAGQAWKYRTLFPLMIENWRKDFAQGDFPFYFVQLAPFNAIPKAPGDSNWAELREAQTMTLKLPNTGMAVITDFGDEFDIHPIPKRPVGERLALIARARDYGEKIPYQGPTFKSVKFEGDKAVLTFDNVHGGLVAKKLIATPLRETSKGKNAWRVDPTATDVELTGFTIAGKDRKFVDAKAVIQGDQIVVTSKDVPEPVAVRYGWANHPLCGLFNQAGLPASPFRTDDFPGITQPKQ